jgi:hypothetical protein
MRATTADEAGGKDPSLFVERRDHMSRLTDDDDEDPSSHVSP